MSSFPARTTGHQTMVQTVFRLGSKRTALPSTALVLVLYMGFSKAAWPLLFSCTEQPVYWVFGVVLCKRTNRTRTILRHQTIKELAPGGAANKFKEVIRELLQVTS